MKKKILHLLASNSYSGAENVVCTIIENCCDKYDMYYCSMDGPIREILEKRNITFIPLTSFSVGAIKKIVKEYQIDIVQAHDFKASFVASFLKVKVISQLHCNYKLLPCRQLVGCVYSIIQKKFAKVVVVSREILEEASFGKKIASKTIVVDNVLDPKVVIEKAKEFETLSYDIVYVGRLIPLKQPLFLIDIIKDLKKKYPNIRACIVGDGELYEECNQKIMMEDLVSNIDLLGFKNNPYPYIKNSKIAILPSTFEGLPMSVIEAMILDVMVVNSGVGGLADMFAGYSKYICQEKEDYVRCVTNLLEDKNESYKKDCQKMIKKFTDIKKYRQIFIKMYDEVLK